MSASCLSLLMRLRLWRVWVLLASSSSSSSAAPASIAAPAVPLSAIPDMAITIPAASDNAASAAHATVDEQTSSIASEERLLEALGRCPVGTTVDLTRRPGVSARASSEETVKTPASFAIDGLLETRWASAFSDKQFLEIELGGRYEVCVSVQRMLMHARAICKREATLLMSDVMHAHSCDAPGR